MDKNLFNRVGRPSKRSAPSTEIVGLSFKVDPRLKNLMIDISEGSDISMTELLLTLMLKEAGLESLDDYSQ